MYQRCQGSGPAGCRMRAEPGTRGSVCREHCCLRPCARRGGVPCGGPCCWRTGSSEASGRGLPRLQRARVCSYSPGRLIWAVRISVVGGRGARRWPHVCGQPGTGAARAPPKRDRVSLAPFWVYNRALRGSVKSRGRASAGKRRRPGIRVGGDTLRTCRSPGPKGGGDLALSRACGRQRSSPGDLVTCGSGSWRASCSSPACRALAGTWWRSCSTAA